MPTTSQNKPSPDINSPPPVDVERLHIVAETDAEKATILEIFFRIAMETMAALQTAVSNNNPVQWKKSAHHLKGSAVNLGMNILAQKLERAETGGEFSPEACDSQLQDIAYEIEHVKSYLAFTPGGKTGG